MLWLVQPCTLLAFVAARLHGSLFISCPSGPQGLCSGATGCSVTSHPITLQILHSSSLGRTGLGCMRDRSPALIPEEIANSVICVNALSSFPLLRLSAAY